MEEIFESRKSLVKTSWMEAVKEKEKIEKQVIDRSFSKELIMIDHLFSISFSLFHRFSFKNFPWAPIFPF